jgi:hypothetical protein
MPANPSAHSRHREAASPSQSGPGRLVEIDAGRPIRQAANRPLGFPSGHTKLPIIDAKPFQAVSLVAATSFGSGSGLSRLMEIEAHPRRADVQAMTAMVSGSSDHLPVVSGDAKPANIQANGGDDE